MNLENIIQKASQRLKSYNIQSYNLDAQLILSNILKITRESLISNNLSISNLLFPVSRCSFMNFKIPDYILNMQISRFCGQHCFRYLIMY